jgi:hypothetical protein
MKVNVLFINHDLVNCGVYQYGLNVFHILKKTNNINYIYKEINSIDHYNKILDELTDINYIIYNYHNSTLYWLNKSNIQKKIKNIGIMHESYFDGFDYYIDIGNMNNYIPRPIFENLDDLIISNENKDFINYKEDNIPIIGSFGFAFHSKCFEKIVKMVNEQYDYAIIKMVITQPFFQYNDEVFQDIKQKCLDENKKPNIKILITNDFFSNDEILLFLKSNTINMFLYDDLKGRGLSSVIDYAISVKKPFGISNSFMFRHVYSDEICLYNKSIQYVIDNTDKYREQIYNNNANIQLINTFSKIINYVNGIIHTYFLSFANEPFYHALERIEKQAVESQLFDKIKIYRDTDLPQYTEFWERHKELLLNNRGYGFWIWKPFLIMKTLEEMNENDIFIYADSGCEINPNGKALLNSYIELLNQNPSGILSFCIDTYCMKDYNSSEKNYTKMDAFKHLECEFLLETQQLHATCFMIRKCPYSEFMVKLWYNTCCHYSLLDDSPSVSPNYDGFLEHRHDQSIWSLIRKKYGSIVLNDQVQGKSNQIIWCARNNTNISFLPNIQRIQELNRRIAYIVLNKPETDVFWQRNTSLSNIKSNDIFYIDHENIEMYYNFFKNKKEYDYYVFLKDDQFVFPLRLENFLLDKNPDELECYCHSNGNQILNTFHVISRRTYDQLHGYLYVMILMNIPTIEVATHFIMQENGIKQINEPLMIFSLEECFADNTNNYKKLVFNNVGLPHKAHHTWSFLDNYI